MSKSIRIISIFTLIVSFVFAGSVTSESNKTREIPDLLYKMKLKDLGLYEEIISGSTQTRHEP